MKPPDNPGDIAELLNVVPPRTKNEILEKTTIKAVGIASKLGPEFDSPAVKRLREKLKQNLHYVKSPKTKEFIEKHMETPEFWESAYEIITFLTCSLLESARIVSVKVDSPKQESKKNDKNID